MIGQTVCHPTAFQDGWVLDVRLRPPRQGWQDNSRGSSPPVNSTFAPAPWKGAGTPTHTLGPPYGPPGLLHPSRVRRVDGVGSGGWKPPAIVRHPCRGGRRREPTAQSIWKSLGAQRRISQAWYLRPRGLWSALVSRVRVGTFGEVLRCAQDDRGLKGTRHRERTTNAAGHGL